MKVSMFLKLYVMFTLLIINKAEIEEEQPNLPSQDEKNSTNEELAEGKPEEIIKESEHDIKEDSKETKEDKIVQEEVKENKEEEEKNTKNEIPNENKENENIVIGTKDEIKENENAKEEKKDILNEEENKLNEENKNTETNDNLNNEDQYQHDHQHEDHHHHEEYKEESTESKKNSEKLQKLKILFEKYMMAFHTDLLRVVPFPYDYLSMFVLGYLITKFIFRSKKTFTIKKKKNLSDINVVTIELKLKEISKLQEKLKNNEGNKVEQKNQDNLIKDLNEKVDLKRIENILKELNTLKTDLINRNQEDSTEKKLQNNICDLQMNILEKAGYGEDEEDDDKEN